ncbi:MAG: hypothetical protein O7D27_06440, partial [Alphaproteobacteria bacterium]|nr:hypothetical protein [Alphaproteobacteria bacterium]
MAHKKVLMFSFWSVCPDRGGWQLPPVPCRSLCPLLTQSGQDNINLRAGRHLQLAFNAVLIDQL